MHDAGLDEWRRRADHHRHFLDRQLHEVAELNKATRHKLEETKGARQAARVEAASAFLPVFDPVTLELCERLGNLPPGWAASQLQKVQKEDHALAAGIAAIDRDDNFQRYEALLGAQGEWKDELAEHEKHLAPLREDLHRYTHLPSFLELIETGYDTPAYTVGWYQLSYYRHWKHADMACEALGQEPFGLLRQLYLQVKGKHDQTKQKKDEVHARVQALERLKHDRDAKVARREALRGPAPLEESRVVAGEWLAACDRRALAQNLRQAGREDLLNAVMKLDGLEAKSAYLESMLDEDLRSDLDAERNKLDRDRTKYQRPKKAGTRFPIAALDKRFQDRPQRWRRRLEQRQAILARLSDYDDWDDVDYDTWQTGTPWWFMMSGRSDPGYGARFDDVSGWMTSQPGWTYQRVRRVRSDYLDDAAAALANQRQDSGRDVS